MVKFIYSEKATKFCEIFTLFLTVCTVVKSKEKISQNFVAFSEYRNFKVVLNSHKLIVQLLVHFLTSIEIEALNWTLTGSSLTSSKEVLQAA